MVIQSTCFISAKKSTRVPWTTAEEAEMKNLFKSFFTRKKCPKQTDCEAAKAISRTKGGVIHLRFWETLKKKVNNMIQKQK